MRKTKGMLALLLSAGMAVLTAGCSTSSSSEIIDSVIVYTTESDSETEKSTEGESLTEATTENDTESETETDTRTETDTESEAETDSETITESDTETDTLESTAEETGLETTTEIITETVTEPIQSETTKEKMTQTETQPNAAGLTAVAQVRNYVNVRTAPNTTSGIVGKIYNNCAATILTEVEGEDGLWYYMVSGDVAGYIKAQFFVVGEEAEALRETIGKTFATIVNDYTRVRTTPSLENLDNVVTMYRTGTEVAVLAIEGDFAQIQTDAASTGYVHTSCLNIWKKFDVAISIEEEQRQIEEQRRREEEASIALSLWESASAESSSIQASIEQSQAQAAYEASVAQSIAIAQSQQAAYEASVAAAAAASQQAAAAAAAAAATAAQATNNALRNAIVTYACQFVGRPYVLAGRSLYNGTDCSGFTHLVYANFGYTNLSWSPVGQSNQGTRIPYQQAQPGDLLFYSNSTSYLGHVAMYIGNGKIVHAASPQYGICIWDWTYRIPLFAVTFIG